MEDTQVYEVQLQNHLGQDLVKIYGRARSIAEASILAVEAHPDLKPVASGVRKFGNFSFDCMELKVPEVKKETLAIPAPENGAKLADSALPGPSDDE